MQQGATIIQFPIPTSSRVSGPARLVTSLGSLQAALDEQQRTLREWRFALAELSIGVAGLGHSLVVYQDNLAEVTERLETLRNTNAGLVAWTDGESKN